MKLYHSLVFAIFFGLSAPFVTAASLADSDHIRVIAFPIPLMIESEQQGLFIELTRRIAELESLPISITITSTPRALVQFATEEFDVMVPGVEGMFRDDRGALPGTENIYLKRDIVFSRRRSPVYRSITELTGQFVGLTRGYPYAPALLSSPEINTVFVNTDEQNARLLLAGRIDAFVAEQHSGIQAFKNIGHLDDVHFENNQWISELRVFYAFRNSEKGRALEAQFARAIRKLKKSGEFHTIINHPGRTTPQH